MRPRTLLAILFVLSGMAGLIYESIWSRYLGLFVGHGAYAQILVLVIYLGGMSLGALLTARRSERLADPLLGYAWAEAAAGVLGLAFHPVFVAVTGVAYDSWFPAVGAGAALQAVKWSVAGALILPQSVILGATFPLMTAAVLRRTPEAPGRTIALLYFANSFGAAGGALVSGFFLAGAVGLPGTVMTAGAINLAVALGAVALRRTREKPKKPLAKSGRSRKAATASPEASTIQADPANSSGLPRLLLLTAFGTAVASFFYEIAWIRMLSLVLGSATRSFELMLSAFILGLALGAFWVRTRADRFADPLQALGVLQWVMGTLALATLPLYLYSFAWMSDAVSTFPHDDGGYRLFTLVRYGISLAVMLPATFCAGTTLPLITRSLMAAGHGERAVGATYGVNTLGSILGAALAGLLLLPLLGLRGVLLAGALVDAGLGLLLLRRAASGSKSAARALRLGAGSIAVVAILVWIFVPLDPLLLTSGVYRSGMLADPAHVHIVSYRHGRTASVSLESYPVNQSLTLSTNGKGDASLRALWLQPPARRPKTVFQLDESTQALLAIVPLAFAKEAREGAVIGQGSGMTSHYLLGSPTLRHLTTIEIEPEVIRASRLLYPANRRVFDDPRSRFAIDDAKSFFAGRRTSFDVIVSEPSNPWVSGVAGLFSTEFYRRVARQLSAHGVFGQWLHVYELSDDLALSVIAALQQNFRDYQIFIINGGDLLIVATNRPEGLTPDWSVATWPAIAADLANLPPFTPNLFEALRGGDRATLEPLVRRMPANSDYHPILDLGAEKTRFMRQTAEGFLMLHDDRFSLCWNGDAHRIFPLPNWPVPAPDVPRLRDLSMSAALQRPLEGIAPTEVDPRLPDAIQRRALMQSALRGGRPPADWRAWLFELAAAEKDWHAGTMGVVDEGFYGLLVDFLERGQAPPQAREAVAFLHDSATWRFAEASREGDVLLAEAAGGRDWLPASVLLDGLVAAKLATGDAPGARRAFDVLRLRAAWDFTDLRSRLLLARLEAPATR